jgi:pyruvate,orthophosphate dikinase
LQPLLGGKGVGLSEMRRLGIPTLPGFVITTEAWKTHTQGSRSLIPGLWKEIKKALGGLEEETGRGFGSFSSPLIVSVRSSPLVSMPGQLKTILNVGLNTEIAGGLAGASERPSYAYEALLRLVQMYAEAVHRMPKLALSTSSAGDGKGTAAERPLAEPDPRDLRSSVTDLLATYRERIGDGFPPDPYLQLERSIAAVFDSWFSEHAAEYRAFNRIPDDLGTAVIVQQMAFGNVGTHSGSGVVFTRSPATGERGLYGEYLPRSQGEQLVAGLVTPGDISDLGREMPDVYDQLEAICSRLETFHRDVQDVEFTIEKGKLWILQTREAKRAPLAVVKVAVDLADEGLITRAEAVRRVKPAVLDELAGAALVDPSGAEMVAHGIQSSPGAATGRVAFNRGQVKSLSAERLPIILVTKETSADDAAIMPLVSGILTQHGGATSHAAVVARGLGKPCVVGCEGMEIDRDQGVVRFGDLVVTAGEEISIDGTTGRAFRGSVALVSGSAFESHELRSLLGWSDELSRLKVLADVCTPAETEVVLGWCPEGVGLCRTERLYYDSAFLPIFRRSLVADSATSRRLALEELGLLHQEEYRGILRAARGHRLTVRLLNAPLDHFLPERDTLVTELAELRLLHGWNEEVGQREEMLQAVDAWRQSCPRQNLRGARLGIAVPDVIEAQVGSLFAAVCHLKDEELPDDLRILVPFVSHAGEMVYLLSLIGSVAETVKESTGKSIAYSVGAAIETPRAAVAAGQLGGLLDFLCIDMDGLTETVSSFSTGDGERFPRADLGEDAASLFELATGRARAARPDVELGAYGSYCHNRQAITLFDEWGLDFVCCHPSYLLKVRLMAGQVVGDE